MDAEFEDENLGDMQVGDFEDEGECEDDDCMEDPFCVKCLEQCSNCEQGNCYDCAAIKLVKCAVCGGKICRDCMEIGQPGCDCELMPLTCVCTKCVTQNKQFFKHVWLLYLRLNLFSTLTTFDSNK